MQLFETFCEEASSFLLSLLASWIPVIYNVFAEELGLHGHGWKPWKLIVLSNLCIYFPFEP